MGRNMKERCRGIGEGRLQAAGQCKSKDDWERMCKDMPEYPLGKLGPCWTQMTSYHVDNYAAEVGFFTDVLGLGINALGADFAMFTNPEKAFFIAVVPADAEHPVTPPKSISIQFMVQDMAATAKDLTARGIVFEDGPKPQSEGSPLSHAVFRTPHGVSIELWCFQPEAAEKEPAPKSAASKTTEKSPVGAGAK